jgi:hypothetical protein
MDAGELAREATELLVVEGATYDSRHRQLNSVLGRTSDRQAIQAFAAIVHDWTATESAAWMEWPAMSLVFLREREPLCLYGLLSGARWIRTPVDGDRELAQPDSIAAGLDALGVEVPAAS